MMRVTVLGSGSKGNALLIDSGRATILVDAGFGCRSLLRRLTAAGYAPAAISALVLTHEHSDHACGALAAARKWSWPIFASKGTLSGLLRDDASSEEEALDEPADIEVKPMPRMEALAHDGTDVSGMHVRGFSVSHDATEPLALTIENPMSGVRLGIATDLGYAPPTLTAAFAHLDVLVVESNHDVEMLRNGPYPAVLKRRIASRHGHLSNEAASAFAGSCVHRGLRHVVLAHLSETNNRPEIALGRMTQVLRQRGWQGETIAAASQATPTGPFTTASSTSVRTVAATQLSLLL